MSFIGSTTAYPTVTPAGADLVPIVQGGAQKTALFSSFSSGGGGDAVPSGRLTLTTGVPVTTADVTAAVTVYWTPYNGNQMQLWNGAAWLAYTFVETGLALGAVTAANCYDVFAYQNAGTLALEKLAWTNATTRATAVTLQDGRYCKSGDKSRLYLGTFYTTSTTTTEDSAGGVASQVGGKRFLWNYYNRVSRSLGVIEKTANWSYGTATFRMANNTAGNRVEFIVGLAEDAIAADLKSTVFCASNTQAIQSAIGLDTTTASSGLVSGAINGTGTGGYFNPSGSLRTIPAAGYHFLSWNEKGSAGTCVFLGDNGGDGQQSGISAELQA